MLRIILVCFVITSLAHPPVLAQKLLPNASAFLTYQKKRELLISAHRGGPARLLPENCLATFQHTSRSVNMMVELDVGMTKDSMLVLMHDNTLDRTTNGTGNLSEQYWKDINELYLRDNEGNLTSNKIPTLAEALAWSKENALLFIDVKRGVPFENIVREVQKADAGDRVIIITYNTRDALTVYKLNPDLVLSVSANSVPQLKQWEKSGIHKENLVYFMGTRKLDKRLIRRIHRQGRMGILGTMSKWDQKAIKRGDKIYLRLKRKGVDIVATDRPLAAWLVSNSDEG